MTANAHANPRSIENRLALLAREAEHLWLQIEALRAEVDIEAKRTDRKKSEGGSDEE